MPALRVFWPPAHNREKRILQAIWRRQIQQVQENTGLPLRLCYVLHSNAHKTLDVSIKMPMPASRTTRGRVLLNVLLKIQIIRRCSAVLGLILSEVSKDHTTFKFRVKSLRDASKCRTRRRTAVSQKT